MGKKYSPFAPTMRCDPAALREHCLHSSGFVSENGRGRPFVSRTRFAVGSSSTGKLPKGDSGRPPFQLRPPSFRESSAHASTTSERRAPAPGRRAWPGPERRRRGGRRGARGRRQPGLQPALAARGAARDDDRARRSGGGTATGLPSRRAGAGAPSSRRDRGRAGRGVRRDPPSSRRRDHRGRLRPEPRGRALRRMHLDLQSGDRPAASGRDAHPQPRPRATRGRSHPGARPREPRASGQPPPPEPDPGAADPRGQDGRRRRAGGRPLARAQQPPRDHRWLRPGAAAANPARQPWPPPAPTAPTSSSPTS